MVFETIDESNVRAYVCICACIFIHMLLVKSVRMHLSKFEL